MRSTITKDQEDRIRERVLLSTLPSGLGTTDNACSVASINLELTGELTGDIPDCMSEVVGNWIETIQDAMPDSIRNSEEWKLLLPFAAGTGRGHEAKRSLIIQKWMWETVLPYLQPQADEGGYGNAWRAMTTERTESAAEAASRSASASWAAAEVAAARSARASAGAAWSAVWKHFDPCNLLARLIEVSK